MEPTEKISKGLNVFVERSCEVLQKLGESLVIVINALARAYLKKQKPRLPRKLKKKYKKIGIYEQWRKDNGLC